MQQGILKTGGYLPLAINKARRNIFAGLPTFRKMLLRLRSLLLLLLLPAAGCGVYSFTGAAIPGKSINIHVLENRARYISPQLTAALTEKIRARILSQTGLAPVNNESAEYDLAGAVSTYEVTVTNVQNTQQATTNRLTIAVAMTFKNKTTPKGDFQQTFTRFADFGATQSLQSVEARLIEDIGTQLADDIFNKAFVNW